MHYCTAEIKLAGEANTIVPRDSFNPVSWPELEIIRAIHGEASIVDVKPFVRIERSAKDEKERLRAIYGSVVEDVFPGRNPQMEMEAPKANIPAQTPLWKDPVEKDPMREGAVAAPPVEKPVVETPVDKTAQAKPRSGTPF